MCGEDEGTIDDATSPPLSLGKLSGLSGQAAVVEGAGISCSTPFLGGIKCGIQKVGSAIKHKIEAAVNWAWQHGGRQVAHIVRRCVVGAAGGIAVGVVAGAVVFGGVFYWAFSETGGPLLGWAAVPVGAAGGAALALTPLAATVAGLGGCLYSIATGQ